MKYFILVLILVFLSCQQAKVGKTPVTTDSVRHMATSDMVIGFNGSIGGERIDGPANVRSSVNGKLIFILNDFVEVTATQADSGWLQVGVIADLTQKQVDENMIHSGTKLYVGGKQVGVAAVDIEIAGVAQTNEGYKTDLIGYTSVSNIRPNSIVEHAFESIVNGTPRPLIIRHFTGFLKNFRFNDFDGLLPEFSAYEIDENWIEDPSPLLRLWLFFEDDKFFGVFHSRPLQLKDANTVKVNKSFHFTTFSDDKTIVDSLIGEFNTYLMTVD